MYRLSIVILFIFVLFSASVYGQERSDSEDYKQQLIVEFQHVDSHQDFLEQLNRLDLPLNFVKKLSQSTPIYLLQCQSGNRADIAWDLLNSHLISSVINNEKTELRTTPNDPKLSAQWPIQQIKMDLAWNYTTGGTTLDGDEIVVAVIDDGFHLEHEDLVDNIYNNPFDQPGDMNSDGCPGDCGVDDDGDGLIDEDNLGREPGDQGYDPSYRSDDDENGYKDDVQGFNTKNGSGTHLVTSHGTHVAGILGAKGNNAIGVSGVNWDIKILPISEALNVARVIEAAHYLTDMRKKYNDSDGGKGAFIVANNYSAGIELAFPSDYPTWCKIYDMMGQVGILSTVAVPNKSVNIDRDGDMPSLCESEYLVSVTSSNNVDNLSEDTGFGKINVDVAAPGENIYVLSATTESGYDTTTGTSMASPLAAGAIGLLYSVPCQNFLDYFKQNPTKVDSLARIVMQSGDVQESLSSLTKYESRMNVYKMMAKIGLFCGGSEDEFSIGNLRPNPTTDELTFDFIADPSEEIYVEIYNTLGQKIQSKVMIFPLYEESKYTVFTSDLLPGLYYLSIIQGKKRIAEKFIKG